MNYNDIKYTVKILLKLKYSIFMNSKVITVYYEINCL